MEMLQKITISMGFRIPFKAPISSFINLRISISQTNIFQVWIDFSTIFDAFLLFYAASK